jgi:hypothetical protein
MRLIPPAMLMIVLCVSCATQAQPSMPAPATAPASPAVSLFDPAKHMRVAEVKPGMTGYGLSVFHGTAIDRFDVEVISVLHNFNPQYDVVLIRCHGANLEHTGAIAGMSGSPIYLRDDQGRDRLIGAFAYGWPLMKDPIAGVQPIEYMLDVGMTLKPEAASTQQAASLQRSSGGGGTAQYTFDPLKARKSLRQLLSGHSSRGLSTPLAGGGDGTQLSPLATPLMVSGVSPRVLQQFDPILRSQGLVALQAGGISGGAMPSTQSAAELVPGAVLAAPLLTGDVEMTAIGTCTEVIGDRIFGFGHPFNNEGPITLPMGSGQIHGIIANLSQSFKLGAMTQLRGTLIADQAVGVAGRLGKAPPTIPIDIRVSYSDGSMDTTYHFNAAAHPRLTPTLTALAVTSALSGRRDLPQYHTVSYDLKLDFADDQSVEIKDVAVNSAGLEVPLMMSLPVELASDNPFERVMLKKISGSVVITPEAHEADILSVSLPKLKYRPGETLKAFVRYRPFRADEGIMPVELQLPHDLKNGKYELMVSDQMSFLEEEQTARPFRFKYESVNDIFNVLRDVTSIHANALYIRLLRQSDGIAVGRTAMPLLPSSRRQVLMDAGRSNITEFVSSAVKIIPTELVMNGSERFEIQIDAEDRVEVGGKAAAKPPEPRAAPANPAAEPAPNRPRLNPSPAPPPAPGPRPAPSPAPPEAP